jgi:hypothetical protein
MTQVTHKEKIKEEVLNELARDHHYSNFDYWEKDEREMLKQETRFWQDMITNTDLIKKAVDKTMQKTIQEIFNDINKLPLTTGQNTKILELKQKYGLK